MRRLILALAALLLTGTQSVAQVADLTGALYANTENRRASYSAATSFTTVSGDVFCITGSATRTIRITTLRLSGSAASAATTTAALNVRSAVDTGGTSSSVTAVPLDSNNAAATAGVKSYTVAPTPGTLVGAVRDDVLPVMATTTPALSVTPLVWTFGAGTQELVLRGTTQQACVNTTGITNFLVSVDWTEE